VSRERGKGKGFIYPVRGRERGKKPSATKAVHKQKGEKNPRYAEYSLPCYIRGGEIEEKTLELAASL